MSSFQGWQAKIAFFEGAFTPVRRQEETPTQEIQVLNKIVSNAMYMYTVQYN